MEYIVLFRPFVCSCSYFKLNKKRGEAAKADPERRCFKELHSFKNPTARLVNRQAGTDFWYFFLGRACSLQPYAINVFITVCMVQCRSSSAQVHLIMRARSCEPANQKPDGPITQPIKFQVTTERSGDNTSDLMWRRPRRLQSLKSHNLLSDSQGRGTKRGHNCRRSYTAEGPDTW